MESSESIIEWGIKPLIGVERKRFNMIDKHNLNCQAKWQLTKRILTKKKKRIEALGRKHTRLNKRPKEANTTQQRGVVYRNSNPHDFWTLQKETKWKEYRIQTMTKVALKALKYTHVWGRNP